MTRSNLASNRSSAPVPATQSLRVGPPRGPQSPSAKPKERKDESLTPVYIAVAVLLAGSAAGGSYYFAPAADQVRSPLHAWLRPSGYIGQTAGILSLLIFIFLWLYPLRKKYRWLAWTGVMSKWLDVHVAVALVLPFLAAIHAAWRFDGVIGLGYWSMIIVALSGIAGRYLYVHIPRSATGLELSAEEIAAERHELMAAVAANSGLPVAQVESVLRSDPTPADGVGFMKTIVLMVQDDLARRRAARAFRRICAKRPGGKQLDRRALREVVRLASREMALTQQARMLEATRNIFRFWHVAHRPFALTALVAVLVHVGVVVAMGATWFW
jgi:hypothetical protein